MLRREGKVKRLERFLEGSGPRRKPGQIANDTVSEKLPLVRTPPVREHIGYQPRTELGQNIWEIRPQIIASGAPLLDWEDIEREAAAIRDGAGVEDE